jgi:hypothetical protein
VNLLDLIAGVFKPAAELIDELHTSTEERLEQKAKLLDVQARVIQSAIDYERETTLAKANIIKAEAQSEHVITATWRPIVMLCFCGLAVGDALGLLPNDLAPEAWLLLQIGLGGYVVTRSGEKIAKGIIQAKVTGK